MSSVGLLYVAVGLVVTGVMLLGRVGDRGAAPPSLVLGVLQFVTPTSLITCAAGDSAQMPDGDRRRSSALRRTCVPGGRAFAVIWLLSAVLWLTLFMLMALHTAHLAPAIGVLAAGDGVLTAGVSSVLIIGGWWEALALSSSPARAWAWAWLPTAVR